MTRLLILLAVAVSLAWLSELYTQACGKRAIPYRLSGDWAYCALLIVLILFTGLRTDYNDTANYLAGYAKATELNQIVENPSIFRPFHNPLYYAWESLIRSTLDYGQLLIFSTSVFTQVCFLRFFKRYSSNFTFSIFLYITLGTFCFTMAAVKQVVAMAVLTFAFPCLERKRYRSFYILVIIAGLFHTYALIFLFLPMFSGRPWGAFTYLFLGLTLLVFLNFQEAMSVFLRQANALGKALPEEEILNDHSVNVLRLLVYMVPPLISLVFRSWLFRDSSPMDHVFVHMSIISMAFMLMGSRSGANMFGRMAAYFEVGTIVCLPWMLEKVFEIRSYRFVRTITAVCYFAFFSYAFGVSQDFSMTYSSMSLWDFIRGVLTIS